MKPTCFIAMPITTGERDAEIYGDRDHWQHVLQSLFLPALESAGYEAIQPQAEGAHLIHARIIQHLSEADLVLCDLSGHNPNVFLELGIRISLNLPMAVVRDEGTALPFDMSSINTHTYSSRLNAWDVEEQRTTLRQHVEASYRSCAGTNPLWRQFGLAMRAVEPTAEVSPLDAKLTLISDRLDSLQSKLEARSAYGGYTITQAPSGGYYQAPVNWVAASNLGGVVQRAGNATEDLNHVKNIVSSAEQPASNYLDALRRYVEGKELPYAFEASSPESVRVVISKSWRPDDVRELRRLAEKYGVSLMIGTPQSQ